MNNYSESRGIVGQLPPAVEITTKNYSLQPDMVGGWRPNGKIIGPVPLNFDNPIVDAIVDELTSFCSKHKERVIYLGLRPISTYKMHEQIQHQYNYKYSNMYSGIYTQLVAFFRKFHSNFQSKTTRLFRGMNPTLDEGQLKFDSGFEGGNLDAVIKVSPWEYDLFMRIDSNTVGHLQWFNFKVLSLKKKKVKFNICNFKKSKTLYQRGMRPYIHSSSKGTEWFQGCQNVKFDKQPMRYDFLDQQFQYERYSFNCLSFEYQFEDEEQVQFAYSPPFNYSEVLKMTKRLLDTKKNIVSQSTLCESLSGLSIPLLTITNSDSTQRKKCMLVSGRVHPGQANSSHCLNGFLEFICSDAEEACNLRNKVVFKIVPMINPDGVVVGNFRTSLAGRDLNRMFKTNQDVLYPEVKALKLLVIKLKQEYANRFQFFLDFHGHSVKKNVFIYGPEYALGDNNYYRTRMLPKLISTRTDMFRYYSCLFRIAEFKRSTARAVVLRQVPHCYTIEASNSCYFSNQEKKNIDFTVAGWHLMGRQLGLSLFDYLQHVQEQENLAMERRRKMRETKNKKKFKRPSSNQDRFHKNNNTTRQKMRLPSVNSLVESPQKVLFNLQANLIPDKTKELLEQIMKDQENHCRSGSDDFSEGGSDSESGDDLGKDVINDLHQKILDCLDDFQCRFYNRKKVKSTKLKMQSDDFNDPNSPKKQKPKIKVIQLIPSLRKRAQHSILQLKRMSVHKGQLYSTHKAQSVIQKLSVQSGQRIFSKSLAKTHITSDISNLFLRTKQINFDRAIVL